MEELAQQVGCQQKEEPGGQQPRGSVSPPLQRAKHRGGAVQQRQGQPQRQRQHGRLEDQLQGGRRRRRQAGQIFPLQPGGQPHGDPQRQHPAAAGGAAKADFGILPRHGMAPFPLIA